ncbi:MULTISPECIES: DeoR/GlpR family DNA-binding transcription regulator [Pseudomonas]|uniref:Putative transcriptional regulator of sugar metabolism, DeoR family n=2 Tax=Pseudomonas TaxID=286 RepID=A0A0P9LVK8_9PSED|nr:MULTISPECIES: DeoR/GlpR family DNA-binding transcription regulator [Pseudomonas]EKG34705.1 DeoR family transcriptional regulator [Pseudomonas syringae pv. avellanae str. ISPaVe037]EKG34762.1 DeoR family transcriptional regulator [Pseudomonas syringae pv. avellanae str. ISPaVe013]ELP95909.1 regulatory protein, DeoR [Pseudomonas syringae BRIP34881]ELP96276.1 regulatory protein, DeoR [Pseudomonas syringae BRIP34876]EPF68888.1 Putative transcriptional regulator of sugar metabolism, DeoR family 
MSTEEEIAISGGTPMIPDQRRELMLRQLRKHQVLSVHQLMEMFDCSHMTIRRDIAQLEQEGRAYSVTGGVRIASQVHSEPSHQSKAVVELPHKQGMARLAAGLLHPDMTIYLDAGTSTLEIVPHIIALSGMTVVTNDFGVVNALADAAHVDVIHTGGLLDHPNRSSVGGLAAATLRQLATDVAFMSTSSWDLQRGTTTPSALKVEVKQAAMQSASQTVLIATSSKYGTFGMYKVAGLEQFDTIITDAALAEAAADGIRKQRIELLLAPVGGRSK